MNEKIKDIFSVFSAEKHFVPCTISEIPPGKETLNVTAGQNANWTYANFFLLPEESSIKNFSINEGQYVVRKDHDKDIWVICDYTCNPIAQGFNEIQSFVDSVLYAEKTRIKSLRNNEGSEQEALEEDPRQIIWYGAPGTGKSHKINELVATGNHIRITFHPDSDYASFVGAYKPTMSEGSQRLFSKDELISLLNQLKKNDVTYPCQKFASDYWYSLKDLSASDVKEIINTCGFTEHFYQEINKGIAIGLHNHDKGLTEKKITYEFVAQAFLLAYVEAWKRKQRIMTDNDGNNIPMPKFMNDKYYLIIEEINRGNCAQIFGDLFQLLDRDKNGESSYAIRPDQDMKRYLMDQFQSLEGLPESIRKGEVMKLPSNLYLYATMNTSDQSLFPIDSAFKRRWDWEYVPIKYSNTDWSIDIDGIKYPWVKFQAEVNTRILKDTGSEDKMMGDYFVNPRTKVITKNLFLNKVLFYLWNDVCKDGDTDIFPSDNDFSFSKLYGKDGTNIIKSMMEKLGIEPDNGSSPIVEIQSEDEENNDFNHSKHNKLVSVTLDGIKYEPNTTKFDLYLNIIKKIGIEQVAPIVSVCSYKRYGRPLISTEKYDEILNAPSFSYVQVGDYYVVKGIDDDTKINILQELKDALNLNMEIEIG